MSKQMSVIALGLWVVVMPYLGIYRSWLTVCMVLSGVALMVIGFCFAEKRWHKSTTLFMRCLRQKDVARAYTKSLRR